MGSIGQETSSGLRHILGVLRRWWLLLLVSTAFTVGIASLALLSAEDRFVSHSELLISQPVLVNDPEVARETVEKLNELMPTFASIAESDVVLEAVRTSLSIGESLDDLRADIDVTRVPETLILAVDVRRDSEDEVVDLADALIEQFTLRLGRIVAGGQATTAEIEATSLRSPNSNLLSENRVRTVVVAIVVGFGLAAVAAFALDRS